MDEDGGNVVIRGASMGGIDGMVYMMGKKVGRYGIFFFDGLHVCIVVGRWCRSRKCSGVQG